MKPVTVESSAVPAVTALLAGQVTTDSQWVKAKKIKGNMCKLIKHLYQSVNTFAKNNHSTTKQKNLDHSDDSSLFSYSCKLQRISLAVIAYYCL